LAVGPSRRAVILSSSEGSRLAALQGEQFPGLSTRKIPIFCKN